ncbi:type II toxin-antitoxin system Phd/YefM family antitoxin [Nakamurella aerolata]|uniref:Antitoxin n=1 Tax=Nakamurella aerolata TaxID=1656892 RepID=A0A849A926_9ACTN|nr:type II toxin-antitoxin system Phd/YefM family antitoxin [Nakamurella aerolata]NNG35581.1 type II toxin-antitoxin system Phd/YefM family antitoxin [Nakamurella aerolata]
METISASTARQTLPAQLDRVQAGAEVAITRHGRVVAVLVHPQTLARRRAPEAYDSADAIGARLAAASAEPLKPPALSSARADDLVRSVRNGRTR